MARLRIVKVLASFPFVIAFVAGGCAENTANLTAPSMSVDARLATASIYDPEAMGWSTPARIATSAASPSLAMGADGSAVVVWERRDSGYRAKLLQTSRWRGGLWTSAETVHDHGEANDYYIGFHPVIAMTAGGRALAAWTFASPTLPTAWRDWWAVTDAGPWSRADHFPSRGGQTIEIQLRAEGDDVLAVWRERVGQGRDEAIWSSRWRKDAGWEPSQRLSDSRGYTDGLAVATDGAGRAIALWHHVVDMEAVGVWANVREADGRWGEPTPLADTGFAQDVAFGPGGDAIVLWDEPVSQPAPPWTFRLQARRWSRRAGWASPSVIDSGSNHSFARMAIDGQGNALVAWATGTVDGFLRETLYSTRVAGFDALSGTWGPPRTISEKATRHFRVAVVADSRGDAVVAWWRQEASHSITVARLLRGAGWARPLEMRAPGTEYAVEGAPCLAMGTSGNALLVWSQASDLWYSVLPPS